MNVLLVGILLLSGGEQQSWPGFYEGTLSIPDGPEMTLAVEIFTTMDGSLDAVVASVTQGQRYISAELNVDGNDIHMQLQTPPATLQGARINAGLSLDMRFRQGALDLPLTLHRVDAIRIIARPQTPRSHKGYFEKPVYINNGVDQPVLAGTLSIPDMAGKHPGVLLIAGSGRTDRDAYHNGHRPMAVLANTLAQQGFVVLRFDKRGVYKSAGQHNPVDIDTTIEDARRALEFLQSQPMVDTARVSLVGHSEGSLVAAAIARDTVLDAVVSLAGPGMPVGKLLQHQDYTEALASGATQEEAQAVAALAVKLYASASEMNLEKRNTEIEAIFARATEPQLQAFQKFNGGTGTLSSNWLMRPKLKNLLDMAPEDYWQHVTERLLVINGALDSQVPAKPNAALISNHHAGPSTTCIFPGMNHMLQPADSAATQAYAAIDISVDPRLLALLTAWFDNAETALPSFDDVVCQLKAAKAL